jgi:hypothetical protein
MDFGKNDNNDYPINFQNEFKAPHYSAKMPNEPIANEEPSILDEKSFMEYDDVSLRDPGNLTPRDDGLKGQLDDRVKRNLEKYEFNL